MVIQFIIEVISHVISKPVWLSLFYVNANRNILQNVLVNLDLSTMAKNRNWRAQALVIWMTSTHFSGALAFFWKASKLQSPFIVIA